MLLVCTCGPGCLEESDTAYRPEPCPVGHKGAAASVRAPLRRSHRVPPPAGRGVAAGVRRHRSGSRRRGWHLPARPVRYCAPGRALRPDEIDSFQKISTIPARLQVGLSRCLPAPQTASATGPHIRTCVSGVSRVRRRLTHVTPTADRGVALTELEGPAVVHTATHAGAVVSVPRPQTNRRSLLQSCLGSANECFLS